jgi:hypothetical protein
MVIDEHHSDKCGDTRPDRLARQARDAGEAAASRAVAARRRGEAARERVAELRGWGFRSPCRSRDAANRAANAATAAEAASKRASEACKRASEACKRADTAHENAADAHERAAEAAERARDMPARSSIGGRHREIAPLRPLTDRAANKPPPSVGSTARSATRGNESQW